MEKSPDAFRTISEVAEWLDVPAHVLRFWESRFSQVRPVKRAGGRRYYRPADMALLDGIRKLLHDDGMTIRGVQAMLREQGVRHVAALGRTLETGAAEDETQDAPNVDEERANEPDEPEAPMAEDVEVEEETGRDSTVVSFTAARRRPPPQPDLPFDPPVSLVADPEKAEKAHQDPMGPDTDETAAEERTAQFDSEDAPPVPEDGEATAEPAVPITVPDLPPDPEDNDPQFAGPVRALSRLKTVEPERLSPIRDGLAEIRRKLGESSRRPPPE